MARTVTLSNLRTWARQLADVESDPNITDAELTALVNRHLPEVYDLLLDSGPPDYFAASSTITTAIGTTAYALPADFRALVDVFAQESSIEVRSLAPVRPGERGRYQAPTGVWSFTMEYIPAAPTLSTGTDTFDGVSGWEELIALMVARDVMVKRESDPSILMISIDAMKGRIAARARNRDRGHPRYGVDMDMQGDRACWPYTNTVRVTAYRLRAGNLELYEPLSLTRLP